MQKELMIKDKKFLEFIKQKFILLNDTEDLEEMFEQFLQENDCQINSCSQ